jgi:FtsH-binding integral membrane protein
MIGYGSLGALIFSLYLVYDTQLMLGGKHKYSLRYEALIFTLYLVYDTQLMLGGKHKYCTPSGIKPSSSPCI